ncbi:hypothetical protein BJ165DRAFT_1486911 [Panaeolus papilionaceus]|nr:hypothetical protein BJ165DRAFT_1486911 [Panaeolus papilionaceus]
MTQRDADSRNGLTATHSRGSLIRNRMSAGVHTEGSVEDIDDDHHIIGQLMGVVIGGELGLRLLNMLCWILIYISRYCS